LDDALDVAALAAFLDDALDAATLAIFLDDRLNTLDDRRHMSSLKAASPPDGSTFAFLDDKLATSHRLVDGCTSLRQKRTSTSCKNGDGQSFCTIALHKIIACMQHQHN
jgi:hypothetical protein